MLIDDEPNHAHAKKRPCPFPNAMLKLTSPRHPSKLKMPDAVIN
jgi:hypothetical protein|tara:strand:- start:33720 stop:33851 length:132 start_codon:yes stop_codon:yes gene_type:complete